MPKIILYSTENIIELDLANEVSLEKIAEQLDNGNTFVIEQANGNPFIVNTINLVGISIDNKDKEQEQE